ncbi:MAG: hypothetical protein DNFNHJIP_00499 [Candidatus Argoarchaeum ethanivorans]|uniref:Uncharacterized protein n=1 Tax=Candidatus Argoarchaeum ethanivorans TaxID=2608793 RepID=A0A812A260_9EURY|nr:MAG: hypothetical protein DNFNHJIP_00499 [Candidatus Argoarchaeum ethanivorans]
MDVKISEVLKVHLIKAHGDESMVVCTNDGYAFSSDTKKCKYCDMELIPYVMIPDSAKKHANYFIDELNEKSKYFDLITSLGFSGRYDPHIVAMLTKFRDSGAIICNIDPKANERLPIAQMKIPDTADSVFQGVKENLRGIPMQSLDLEFTPTFPTLDR